MQVSVTVLPTAKTDRLGVADSTGGLIASEILSQLVPRRSKIHFQSYQICGHAAHCSVIRLVLNGTYLGRFQIRFQYILAH